METRCLEDIYFKVKPQSPNKWYIQGYTEPSIADMLVLTGNHGRISSAPFHGGTILALLSSDWCFLGIRVYVHATGMIQNNY